MTSLFKKPKAYQPSEAQKELERQQLEQQKSQESEIAARKYTGYGKNKGRRSLLTGSETGLKSTLG